MDARGRGRDLSLPGPLTAALLVCLLLAAAWITHRLGRAARNRQIRRRSERGRRAHQDARRVLEARGLRVEGAEVPVRGTVWLDGAPREFVLHLDYVVRDGERTLAVEVKSGDRAGSPHTGATRRQLLEYALLADVDGVLHLDMERGVLTEVDFDLPGRGPPSRPGRGPIFLLGVAVGAGVAALLLR